MKFTKEYEFCFFNITNALFESEMYNNKKKKNVAKKLTLVERRMDDYNNRQRRKFL